MLSLTSRENVDIKSNYFIKFSKQTRKIICTKVRHFSKWSRIYLLYKSDGYFENEPWDKSLHPLSKADRKYVCKLK